MGKGKGGGGSKKRKRAKVWDDYDPKAAKESARDDPKNAKKPKGSMFSQWKQQKQVQRAKQRQQLNRVESARASQYERLQQQKLKKKQVNLWATPARKSVSHSQRQRQRDVESSSDADDSEDSEEEAETAMGSEEEEGEEEDDEVHALKRAKKKKPTSIFDAFVRTFGQPTREEEESEEEDQEDAVDEEEDEAEDPVDDADDAEEDQEEQTNAHEPEKEEQEEEEDDNEEEEEEEEDGDHAIEDPYRQRFLLTSLSKHRAEQLDALPRKLALVPSTRSDRNPVQDAPMPLEMHFRGTQEPPLVQPFQTQLIRSRLRHTWQQQEQEQQQAPLDRLSRFEKSVFMQLSNYHDLYFAAQTEATTTSLRRVAMMHLLNHVVKSRDTVVRNNERVRKQQHKQPTLQDDAEPQEYRDQGFCRATVLVLAPLRSCALELVKLLLELLPSTVDTFHNKERFLDEYGVQKGSNDPKEKEDNEDKNEDDEQSEWQKLFATGNNDDCFQIGISLSRKSVRFYSEYHHADVIVASPLAIRQQLGDDAAELDALDKLSCDFLSSIEVCIVDSASCILMQNVDHLRCVLQAINMPPKDAPHADFARLREWNLDFLARYFRQTIVFAHALEPQLNHLVHKLCHNQAGVIQYSHDYNSSASHAIGPSMLRVVPHVKQIFQRFDTGSNANATANATANAADEADARFAYFQSHVFNTLLEKPRKHLLVFVPSYFDFVRVRNLFKQNEKLIRFVSCCEYTTPRQIARARTEFIHGKSHVLLVTERFHFYHQYRIRGIHQIIWYGVPCFGEFYAEWLNMLLLPGAGASSHHQHQLHVPQQQQEMNSIALFSRLDFLRLARIVGTHKAKRMTSQKNTKATYLFC